MSLHARTRGRRFTAIGEEHGDQGTHGSVIGDQKSCAASDQASPLGLVVPISTYFVATHPDRKSTSFAGLSHFDWTIAESHEAATPRAVLLDDSRRTALVVAAS